MTVTILAHKLLEIAQATLSRSVVYRVLSPAQAGRSLEKESNRYSLIGA
jgi:hypothetical protein